MSTAYAKIAPRVLIVDDDPVQLEFLRRILDRCVPKPAVTCAQSGPQAMQLLRDASWDLVVADYKMPRFNGKKVVDAAKREGADAYLVSCEPRTASSAEVRASAHPKSDLAELVPEWIRHVADGGDGGGGGAKGQRGKRRGFRKIRGRRDDGHSNGLSAARALGRAIKTVVFAPDVGHHPHGGRA